MVGEFMKYYAHQVVHAHHDLPEAAFKTVTYAGLYLHECTDPEVAHYINYCYNSLRRWTLFRRLRKYIVAYVNTETGNTVVSYEVRFYEPWSKIQWPT